MPGLHRGVVLGLPALPAFSCCLCSTVDGLSYRALIFRRPPFATLLHLDDDSIRDDPTGSFRRRRARGAGLSIASAMLFHFSCRALRGQLGSVLVFRFPPRTQRLCFPAGACQGFPAGAVVFGLPPLT